VSTLKENKIQLTVSAFLRQQIQRIVDENSSFAQKRQALQEIGEFIERIKDSEYDILAMQREAELALDEKLTNLLETNSQDRMSPFDFQRFTQEKNVHQSDLSIRMLYLP
jgi:adenine-specific DNA methylase